MEDGKFAFDPVLGIEEIVNRRVGENEIQTIETIRSYIDAQEEYASADHDGDGVLEYAQKSSAVPARKMAFSGPMSMVTTQALPPLARFFATRSISRGWILWLSL